MTDEAPANMQHNAEVVSSVMARHGVTPREVSANTGYSQPHVRRVMNGGTSLPIEIFRYLFRRTQDRDLLEIATGDVSDAPRPEDDETLDPAILLYESLLSAQRLAAELARRVSHRECKLDAALISAMADTRTHMVRMEAAHGARQPSGLHLEATA